MEPVATIVAILFLLAALVYVERTSALAAADIQRQAELWADANRDLGATHANVLE